MLYRTLLFTLLFLTSSFTLIAQGTECPILVEEALALVDDACSGLGRNQACYGHSLVTATGIDEAKLNEFGDIGDITEITHLSTLRTAPMQPDDGIWGIAILSVQANLPSSLPGQNATFVVFGDVELTNEIVYSADVEPTEMVIVQSTGNVNLRSGPGTGYGIVGTLTSGEEVTLKGRNDAGDWGYFIWEHTSVWVYLPLMDVESDVTLLPIISPETTDNDNSIYTMPMQAFQLTTNIGTPQCQEAPPDGLLIQAPTGTVVNFLINGIEIEVGSTALLLIENDGQMNVNTFDGSVNVTSSGETQAIEPGYKSTVTRDSPPSEPDVYMYETVQSAPIQLLPEAVTIPITVHGNALSEENDWINSGVMLESGESFSIKATGEVNVFPPCYEIDPASCDDWINGPNGMSVTVREGWDNNRDQPFGLDTYPMPDANGGALLARIGDGDVFFVGEGGTFTANNDGELQFLINDTDYFYDNAGGFVVEITVDN